MTSHCVRSSVGPGFDSVESFFLFFFFFFFSFFFSFPFTSPSYSSTCISFFPLLFLSSSNFFLPFPPAFLPFFFLPIRFLSSLLLVSPFLLLFFLSFLPLFYFRDFFPPFPLLSLSHSFCFCFFFLALKFLSCFTSLPRGLL